MAKVRRTKLDKLACYLMGLTIDNGANIVYIRTPKGWKCKRKGCTTQVKHTHGKYKLN